MSKEHAIRKPPKDTCMLMTSTLDQRDQTQHQIHFVHFLVEFKRKKKIQLNGIQIDAHKYIHNIRSYIHLH